MSAPTVWAQAAETPPDEQSQTPGQPGGEPGETPGEPGETPGEPDETPGQTPGEPDQTPDEPGQPGDELTPEELAELEAALGDDAGVLAESRTAQPAPGARVGGASMSMNPDISLIVDTGVAYVSDNDNLQAGAHDPSETGFNLQQVEMSLGKAVDPYFRLDANLVFSPFGVEVEEAYATTLSLPHNLQARVGQFLTRIGRINATHPHTWDFTDQPFAISRVFGAESNRGPGLELSYLTGLPWYTEIIGSVTDAAGEATARSFFGGQDLPVVSPLDFQLSLMLEQFFELNPNWSLMWGLSVATGPNATGHDNRSDIYAVDLYLKYRPITRSSYTSVSLQTEWFHRRRQIAGDLLDDTSGYAYVFWRFRERWGAAVRYEYGAPARNREGLATGDYLDPEWTGGRHRATVATTLWPTEFSRVRLQGSADMPAWREQPIYALFLAFEFNIGAHGAHEF